MVFIETVGFLVELEALHPAGLSGLVSARRLLGAEKKYEGVSSETLI